MTELKVERRDLAPKGEVLPGVMMTPPLDEDYWSYRVRLTDDQAIVAFPKFTTVGIGFAKEEDWNTNLPFRCSTSLIVRHICHNAGDEKITVAMMCEAVDLIRKAVYEDHGPDPRPEMVNDPDFEATKVLPYNLAEVEKSVAGKLAERVKDMTPQEEKA